MNRMIFRSLALIAFATATSAGAQGVKWHPGHYMMLHGLSKQETHFREIDEISREPVIKGVQLRVWWAQMERSKGNYDFSKIDAYLRKLKSVPGQKRLVVRVMDRKFNTSSRDGIVPDYLESQLVPTKNGYVVRLWEADVMDRLIALYRAIGNRFDDDAYFEGIATEETTLGFAGNFPSGYSPSALAAQYERLVRQAKPALPKSNLWLYANYLGPDSLMTDLIQSLVAPNGAVGGSNVMPGKMTQGQRVWTGRTGADYRGNLAIGSSVESGELGGNLGDYTPRQIAEFAYGTLHVSHLFWARNTSNGDSGQRWSTGILPYLRTNPPTRTNCPSAYGICIR